MFTLKARDKTSLDFFWLKDEFWSEHIPRSLGVSERIRSCSNLKNQIPCSLLHRECQSLEESDNLTDPDVIAQEIVEDLEAALEQFRENVVDLGNHQE